jgi:hypothetical protein
MTFLCWCNVAGEYDACDVTLSVYPHRASLKNIPGHVGNRTYDLWNFNILKSLRVCWSAVFLKMQALCSLLKFIALGNNSSRDKELILEMSTFFFFSLFIYQYSMPTTSSARRPYSP